MMTTFSSTASFALLAVTLATAGCSRRAPEPESTSASPAKPAESTPAAAGGGAAPKTPAGGALTLTWAAPSSWTSVPPSSPMRKATYKIAKAPGDPEDAELAVFYFGVDQGGTVEANMERWVSQFEGARLDKADRSERKINGMTVWTIEVGGAFKGSGMPGAGAPPSAGAKTDYRLLGAIIEAPEGKYFFKMTGPKKTVLGARDDFHKFLETMRSGAS